MKVYLVSYFNLDNVFIEGGTKTFKNLESAKKYVQAEWGEDIFDEGEGSALMNYYFDEKLEGTGIGIWEFELEED